MTPRYRKLAWIGGGAIAVGALLVVALRLSGGDAQQAPPAADIVSAPAIEAAPPVDSTAQEETPPWAQGQPDGGSAIASLAARPAAADPAATMTAAQMAGAIGNLRQQSRQNIRAADAVLHQLEELEKSGNAPPDVRIGALRDNLVIAKRAQVLALELAESTQQPDSPERRQRTEAIVAELQQLQGRLRYDMGTLPAPGPQPGGTQ